MRTAVRCIFGLVIAWPGFLLAEGSKPFPFKVLIELSGHYPITNNIADDDASGTYTKYFSSGFETSARVGTVQEGLYLGGLYEYWIASRTVTLSGVENSDALAYHSVGGEVGWLYHSNPRIFWLATAAALYPMQQQVTSTVGGTATVYYGEKLISFQARGAIGFKLYERVSLLLEGGYRWANLKSLATTLAGVAYLPGGAEFNLSGPFVGAGVGIHL